MVAKEEECGGGGEEHLSFCGGRVSCIVGVARALSERILVELEVKVVLAKEEVWKMGEQQSISEVVL